MSDGRKNSQKVHISSKGPFIFRPQERLDSKWIQIDLLEAILNPETLCLLYNSLIQDREIYFDASGGLLNSAGVTSKLGENGKYYCGLKILNCTCCDGFCGPENGCSCPECTTLTTEEEKRLAIESRTKVPPSSVQLIHEFKWKSDPGAECLEQLIDSLVYEQRHKGAIISENCPFISSTRRASLLCIRHLVALIRCERSKQSLEEIVDKKESDKHLCKEGSDDQDESIEESKDSCSGLARVGARAALRLALALVRRAWRCGEDADVCSALLRDALDAVRALPDAALYAGCGATQPPSSKIWAEVVDSAAEFLHQVVTGQVGCNVPTDDWRTSLCVWVELCARRAELSSILRAARVLLSLPQRSTDNRLPKEDLSAPLGPFLQRMMDIRPSVSNPRDDPDCPTELYLKDVSLLGENELISVRKAGVILMSLLDKLAAPLLPPMKGFETRLKSVQEVYILGAQQLNLGTVKVQQIACGDKYALILSNEGQLFSFTYDAMTPVPVPGMESFNVSAIAVSPLDGGGATWCAPEGGSWTWAGPDGKPPVRDAVLMHHEIVAVAIGPSSSAAITATGTLYITGAGASGNSSAPDCNAPESIAFPTENTERVLDFAFGYGNSQSICCTSEGVVWTWGSEGTPTVVTGLVGIRVNRVYATSQYHAVLSDRGQLYTWGKTESAHMGHGTCEEPVRAPKLVEALRDVFIKSVSLKSDGGVALSNNGVLYSWGPHLPSVLQADSNSVPKGVCFGPEGQLFIWSEEIPRQLPKAMPFVIDLSENTFMLLDNLLEMVLDTSSSPNCVATNQENECLAYACLNLLRLQVHAMQSNPATIEAAPGDSWRPRLRSALAALAGGCAGPDAGRAAKRTLAAAAPVLLPTPRQRLALLLQLLPQGGEAMSSGSRFLLEVVVWTLLGGGGLQEALLHALNSNTTIPNSNLQLSNAYLLTSNEIDQLDIALGNWDNESEKQNEVAEKLKAPSELPTTANNFDFDEKFSTVPLMDLIKQLIRNSSCQTQMRLASSMNDEIIKTENNSPNAEDCVSPGCDLLIRFQRLLFRWVLCGFNERRISAATLLVQHISLIAENAAATMMRAAGLFRNADQQRADNICSILNDDIVERCAAELAAWSVVACKRSSGVIHAAARAIMNLLSAANALSVRVNPCKRMRARSVIRKCDMSNHLSDGGSWIIVAGNVYDVKKFFCESRATIDIVKSYVGHDATDVLTKAEHAIYLPKIFMKHVGVYIDSLPKHIIKDSASIVRTRYLLSSMSNNFSLALTSSGAHLTSSLPIQDVEKQVSAYLSAPFLRGGLQRWKPSNPFDEERSEARSGSTGGSSSTDGNSPENLPRTNSMMASPPQILICLAEAKLHDSLATHLWRAMVRAGGAGGGPALAPEHPAEELRRALLSAVLHHAALAHHALHVATTEIEDGYAKLSPALMEIAKLVQQAKWTIMRTKQQQNRGYKEVCASGIERARWLLYEVRSACGAAVAGLRRLQRSTPQTRRYANLLALLDGSKESKTKQKPLKAFKSAINMSKSDLDMLNRSVQSNNAFKIVDNKTQLHITTTTRRNSIECLPQTKEQLNQQLKIKTHKEDMKGLKSIKKIDTPPQRDLKQYDDDKTPTHEISISSVNTITDNSQLKESVESEKLLFEDDIKNDLMMDDCEKDDDASERSKFVRSWISKEPEKEDNNWLMCEELSTEQKSVVTAIIDFVMSETPCDIDVLRRAMYCQVQRAEIRKNGYELINKVLQTSQTHSESVKYSALLGALGVSPSECAPPANFQPLNPPPLPLEGIESVIPYSKFLILHERSTLMKYLLQELRAKILEGENDTWKVDQHCTVSRSSLQKNPMRARYLVSLLTLLTEKFSKGELEDLIGSGALSLYQTLLRKIGATLQESAIFGTNKQSTDPLCIYEDERTGSRARGESLSGPELASMMKVGTKIVRGKDWKWGEQDGTAGAQGRVVGCLGEDGWVRVAWDAGGTNSYRMGKEGKYDLQLASSPPPAQPLASPPPMPQEIPMDNQRAWRWVRAAVERAIRASSGAASRAVTALLRAPLAVPRRLTIDDATAVALLRVTCHSPETRFLLCDDQFFEMCFKILSSGERVITSDVIYLQIQVCWLLRRVLEEHKGPEAWRCRVVSRLLSLIGRLWLDTHARDYTLKPPSHCASYHDTEIDNRQRVSASASYTGALAACVASLVRDLSHSSSWTRPVASHLHEYLRSAVTLINSGWLRWPEIEKESSQQPIVQPSNQEMFLIVGALCVIGNAERRFRLGQAVKAGGRVGVISRLLQRATLAVTHKDATITQVDLSNVENVENEGISMGMVTDETSLRLWACLLGAIPGQPIADPVYIKSEVDAALLRRQQLDAAVMTAARTALASHRTRLRRVLLDGCDRQEGSGSNLLKKLLALAIRPSPLAAAYTTKELATATHIIMQHLSANYKSEDKLNKSKDMKGNLTLVDKSSNCHFNSAGPSTSKGEKEINSWANCSQVQQVVDMGFTRRAVYAAIQALGGPCQPTVEAIVAYLLERPRLSQDDFAAEQHNSKEMANQAKRKQPFRWRSCFSSEEEYAKYVSDVIAPGMTVRCCKASDKVSLGDMGPVLAVDRENPFNVALQVDWRAAGQVWVRADNTECVGGGAPFAPGDRVRVRASVAQPRYKWGCVDHASIGKVTAISANGRDLTVDFPQQPNWTGQVCEMELVTDATTMGSRVGGASVGWRGALRSLRVSSARANCGARRLLDATPHTYWQSAAEASSHWIRLWMRPGVLIRRLALGAVAGLTGARLTVRAGADFTDHSLTSLLSLPALPSADHLTMVQLIADCEQYYPCIEISIKQNRGTHSDVKVHGLYLTGYRPNILYADVLKNMNFIADDWGEKGAICGNSSESTPQIILNDCPKVYVWGLNDKDQLGGVKGSKVKVPVYSSVISRLKPVQIAGGSKTLFIVSQDGKLYACGEGTNGRLGLGHTNNVASPKVNPYLSHVIVRSVAVHSGGKHALAVTADGKLFSWGEGEDGKLGHGNRQTLETPRCVEALANARIVSAAAGSAHSAAIDSRGRLYTWGLGEYGRLGHGDRTTHTTPKLVEALLEYQVIQVACGSRDAQTLALTKCGKVFSWGDGDFGKLGRGGSEGCELPQNIERLNSLAVVQVDCGAQFSLALTKDGEVWTWGKGDYFRLGHGCDSHVRRPTLVEGLRGKRVISIAVGALHCLAVTEDNQVWAWGDNDHGQQGSGSTCVNRRPAPVTGAPGAVFVAAGSSHSVAWTRPQLHQEPPEPQPLAFPVLKDPFGAYTLDSLQGPAEENAETSSASGIALAASTLALEPLGVSQRALQTLMLAMHTAQARLLLIEALRTVETGLSCSPGIDADDEATEQARLGGGEGPATLPSGSSSPLSASLSSRHSPVMSSSCVSVAALTMSAPESALDDFTSQLNEVDARALLDLLKLAIAGRILDAKDAAKVITDVLLGLSARDSDIAAMLIDECTLSLEAAANSAQPTAPQPVTVDSPHPYPDEAHLSGIVKIPGSRSLRVVFEAGCSSERRNDPLTISHPDGRVLAVRSGRDAADWSQDILVEGDELHWRFTSDATVNGWGWRFTAHPVPSGSSSNEWSSERRILSGACVELAVRILEPRLLKGADQQRASRLAKALATAAQLPQLKWWQRVWCVRRLRSCVWDGGTTKLARHLRAQYEHEEPALRAGAHLNHSLYLQELAWLACSLKLDSRLCSTSPEGQHWTWFKRYCLAIRTATALIERTPLPLPFIQDVRKRLKEMGVWPPEADESSATLPWEDNVSFTRLHDEQILHWVNKSSNDWSGWWGAGGARAVFGWGHNHRGQLGGVDGAKVRTPAHCRTLSQLDPVQLVGGEQTLFAVTPDGKVYATGFGAGGRLGIGGTDSVTAPTLLASIQHVFITKVACNSGGKHCLALSAEGEVYSWGEGEDGKLGHGNRMSYDRPKLITSLSGLEVVAIACGGAHSACLTARGHIYTWGKGRYGRLGHGDSEDQLVPKMVEALANYRVIDVACGSGDAQTLCITDDDNVWSWGDGDYGKLGRGGSEGCKLPMRIDCLKGLGVIKVECGSQFSVALCRCGSVYTWGKGDYHRLGHGTYDHVRKPMKVSGMQGKNVVSIATGSLHCVACTDAGEVYTWGDNDEGQLGDGTTLAAQRPRRVVALLGRRVTRVACGSAHSLALCVDAVRAPRTPPTPPIECHTLRDRTSQHLHARAVLLHQFSELVCANLQLISLEGPMEDLRNLLFYNVKESAFRKAIMSTMVRDRQHGPVVELCRLRRRGGAGTVFAQMVQRMPALTHDALALPHRIWKVKFIGESVDDCGGGYSESIAEMCEELQSGAAGNVLLPTPDSRSDPDRGAYILNPTLNEPQHKQHFQFLGILMGIAIRTGSPLSLSLAEGVWRQLVGLQLRPQDLAEIDKDFLPALLCIRDMKPNSKEFQNLELPFSIPSAAGFEVPLSTRHRKVTSENKKEYVQLALHYRLHEFDAQVKSIREGIARVVPAPFLALFSPTELETLVCGSPDIPVSALRSSAQYKGVEPNAPLVIWFWEVLEELSAAERALFLRFVWGRTRLPRQHPRQRDLVLQVLDKYQPPDHFLPESYTCFFLLKLPRYSCKAVLREKLRYAIHFCKSIDTDEYARVALSTAERASSSESDSDTDAPRPALYNLAR